MQLNTASTFILSSLALLSMTLSYKRLSIIFSSLLLISGLLNIIQYTYDLNLGIDELIIAPFTVTNTTHAGRMSPATTACFILLGCSFLRCSIGKMELLETSLSRSGVAAVLIIALSIILSYIAKITTSYGWFAFTRMAIHTAGSFALLSIGYITYSFSNEKRWCRMHKRLWVPFTVTGCLFILSFYIANISMYHEVRADKKLIATESEIINEQIDKHIHLLTQTLNRMAYRWNRSKELDLDIWAKDAYHLYRDDSAIKSLLILSHQFKPIKVTPSLSNSIATWDYNFSSLFNKNSKISKPTILIPDRKKAQSILFIFPLKPNLYLAAEFDVGVTIRHIINDQLRRLYHIQLTLQDHEIYANLSKISLQEASDAVTKDFYIFDQKWTSKITPHINWKYNTFSLSDLILIFGALTALLSGALANYVLKTIDVANRYKQKEFEHRSILDSAPEGIITLDENGNITSCNKFLLELLRFSEAEMLAKSIWEIIELEDPVFFSPKHKHTTKLRNLKKNLKSFNIFCTNKHGVRFPIDLTISESVFYDNSLHTVILIRNISKLKQTQSKLQGTVKALKRSNIDLEHFAYIASHDLQEPLRMVVNFTKLLEIEYAPKVDKQGHEYINFAVNAAIKMQKLIDDLLTYSRVGHGPLNYEYVNLNKVLKNAIDYIEKDLKECGGQITYDNLPSIKTCKLYLLQIFQNTLTNAIKYRSETRPLKIHVACQAYNTHITLSVSDNGIGIKSEHYETALLPFKRLQYTRTDSGSGIGLAICARIIENLEGKMWIKSEVDKGTTFYFNIPI